MEKIKFLVETDIILEHLTHKESSNPSYLEVLMTKGICFTTVINSAEFFFAVSDNKEKEIVLNVMNGLKVLGLNARYSLNISDFFNKVASVRDALICSVAKNNNLPIVTCNSEKYKDSGLEIINPANMRG